MIWKVLHVIKKLRLKIKYRSFRKEKMKETREPLVNPKRGWFYLYSFELDKDLYTFETGIMLHPEDSIVLLMVGIAGYKDRELPEEALLKLESLLRFFRENDKDVILRITYDHEGNGLEREPISFETVKSHAEQIAGFAASHEKDIFLFQGLLVGKWGEMHSSRFTTEEKLRALYEIFDKNLSGRVFTAVRKPVQWRNLNVQPDPGESLAPVTLGIFNDGMFGSESDLGTYGETGDGKEWNKPWGRLKEQEFTGAIAEKVPCGGEALFGEGFAAMHEPKVYIQDLFRQHITYLNRQHDIKLIRYWERQKIRDKGIWNGSSFFDYISAHLGYRFFVKSVEMFKEKNGCELEFIVENQGFARIYARTDLYLHISEESGEKKDIPVGDNVLGMIDPGGMQRISVRFPVTKGRVYLYAREKDHGKPIMFADQGMHPEGLLLGNMI